MKTQTHVLEGKSTALRVPKRLWTKRDVCEQWGVSLSTVDGLLASGELPCVRIGRSVRIPAEAAEQFLRSRQGPWQAA